MTISQPNRNTIVRIASIFIIGCLSLLFIVPWYTDTVVGTPLHVSQPADVFNSASSLPDDIQPIENDPAKTVPSIPSIPSQDNHDDIDLNDALTSSSATAPTSVASSSPPSQTKATVLRVGQALESTILTSPNNNYRFGLESSGQLSLLNVVTNLELFTSNTKFHWPAQYHVELTPRGVLELTWTNQTTQPSKGKPWASSLLPDCDGIDPESMVDHMDAVSSEGEAEELAAKSPILELLDTGLLQIRSDEKVICRLSRAVDDPGRLAIIYTGFLRTYMKTCEDHKKKLVDEWYGSGGVDIHVYTYYEEVFHEDTDAPTKESIEKNLRECFGDNLKTVTLVHLNDATETWDDPPEAVVKNCEQETLNRHISQYKTIWAAGQRVQKYAIQNGIRYNYILKTRLDLLLHGYIPKLQDLAPMAADGTVIAPRLAMDWNWYVMIHDGELIAGVTDIMAFGRSSQMWTYMNYYLHLKSLLTMERAEEVKEDGTPSGEAAFAKWLSFNTHGHEKMDVNDKETCSPEDELAYYLSVNDIPVQTDWRFQMGLLRNSGGTSRLGKELGEVIFTCPIEGKTWLCPGFVPEG